MVRFTVGFYFNYTGLSRGRPFGPLAHPFAEIALISPEAGVERFFQELASGTEPQVILTAAPAEVLA